MVIFLAETSRKSSAFLFNQIPNPFWDRDSTLIFFWWSLFCCLFHSSYWSSSHWIHVHLIHLNCSEISPIKSLLLQKSISGLQLGIPAARGNCISLYMMLNMTETNVKAQCMEQRTLTESSGLCFWILFSSKSLGISKLVFISFSRLISPLLLHWNHYDLFPELLFALHRAGWTFALLKYFSCGQNDIPNMNVCYFLKSRMMNTYTI